MVCTTNLVFNSGLLRDCTMVNGAGNIVAGASVVGVEPVVVRVERFELGNDYSLSRLLVNGKRLGFVIEDAVREKKVRGETAIPLGNYALGVRVSPKFSNEYVWQNNALVRRGPKSVGAGHEVLWLKDVPNFRFILIHWGNTALDSHGCLIVGKQMGRLNGRRAVLNSRAFYQELYALVYPAAKAGVAKVEVVNAVGDGVVRS